MGAFGLVGLGLLDSSFLFLPLSNDLLLVLLTARKPGLFWYYALMSTLGSKLGATLTDIVSRKIGKTGLEKMINPHRVEKVRKRSKHMRGGFSALLPSCRLLSLHRVRDSRIRSASAPLACIERCRSGTITTLLCTGKCSPATSEAGS
jgi:hypothetical protein